MARREKELVTDENGRLMMGSLLRQERRCSALTTGEAASGVGITRPALSKIETNGVMPSGVLVHKLCNIYGIPAEIVLTAPTHPKFSKGVTVDTSKVEVRLAAPYVSEGVMKIEDTLREMPQKARETAEGILIDVAKSLRERMR